MTSQPDSPPKNRRSAEVSVIVVTYHSGETIADCLESIAAGGASAETVVVDNASTDGTVALASEHLRDGRLLANPINVGFARAANRAWPQTCAPYVLLLNPDSQLRPGTIRALLDFAESHPRAAVIGPRILNPDGSLQHSCFRFPSLTMAVTGFFGLRPLDSPENGRYRLEEYERAHQVEHLLGACLLVRRASADEIGLLDESFYMYFEETDWCYRAHQAGWECWYTPAATVVHCGAHSTSREPERMSAE